MRNLWVMVLWAMLAAILSGCNSTNSYVDPTFGKTTYNDIPRRAAPYKWKIDVEFQRNGKHLSGVDNELRAHVEQVIRASGMALPDGGNDAPTLKVVVNNLASLAGANAKAFGSGLTFGLVGNTVTDAYEMEVVLTSSSGAIKETGYKHAIYTTRGNASAPMVSMESVSLTTAFGKVVEQMLLNALNDLSKNMKEVSPARASK